VLALGWFGLLKTSLRIIATLVALLSLHAFEPKLLPYFSDSQYSDVLKVGLFFMAGALAYAWREKIVLSIPLALALIIPAALLQRTFLQEYALYAALFYLVVCFSTHQRIRRLKLGGDYSYGVYIYGWPIQQIVAHYFPSLHAYGSNFICIPLALLAGYWSWTVIEKPALNFARNRVANKKLKV
jgi:peptidoglycan/LPS O-acetylase OafA/YrhL